MKNFLYLSVCFILITLFPSCVDHDDPKLSPIDTAQVKISVSVKEYPTISWMNSTEEMTINVSDIDMQAPTGVALKSISLVVNNCGVISTLDNKPYSGGPLEFKVPLTRLKGRLTFSLIGNLIKKNCRDAEIIITDNIQKLVFSEEPKFECRGWLYISVKGKSTTGEEYSKSFEVESTDNLSIPVPRSELYWTPASGTASEIEVSLGSGATAWSNTTFDCKILKTTIGHSSGDESTLKMTIPNTPGSLDSQKLQIYALTSYSGSWENITIEPYKLTNVFGIYESE